MWNMLPSVCVCVCLRTDGFSEGFPRSMGRSVCVCVFRRVLLMCTRKPRCQVKRDCFPSSLASCASRPVRFYCVSMETWPIKSRPAVKLLCGIHTHTHTQGREAIGRAAHTPLMTLLGALRFALAGSSLLLKGKHPPPPNLSHCAHL